MCRRRYRNRHPAGIFGNRRRGQPWARKRSFSHNYLRPHGPNGVDLQHNADQPNQRQPAQLQPDLQRVGHRSGPERLHGHKLCGNPFHFCDQRLDLHRHPYRLRHCKYGGHQHQLKPGFRPRRQYRRNLNNRSPEPHHRLCGTNGS